MRTENKPKRPLRKTVKETIDFVYDILSSNPEGYVLAPSSLGYYEALVCSILVNRGIISKTRRTAHNKNHFEFVYKWEATMPPTTVLYGSVADEIRDIKSSYKKKKNAKPKPDDNPMPPETKVEHPDLSSFSEQDLWDELKRRGARIIGSRLVIVKEIELS